MRRFVQQKQNAENELEASISVGDVDEDLIPLLRGINSLDDFYTTSSCAGRISLLLDLGGKGVNRFLGKWHDSVDAKMISDCLKGGCGTVWFMYEPPILHVAASSVVKADWLIKAVREAGFKHSGIQSVKEGRVLVEVMDTERIDAPVKSEGRMLVGEDYISFIVDAANKKLARSRAKVRKLEGLVSR